MKCRKHLIDIYGTWGETALIKASRQGKADIVDYLLKSGADVDKVSGGTGRTALMVAIIHGHLEVVVLLNGKGCDWSIRDRTECQAVHFISNLDSNQLDLVDYVLSQPSVDVNAQDSNGCTVLMKAISLKSPVEILKRILDSGADPNVKSTHGITALMIAILGRYTEAVTILLEYPINLDDVTRDNVSALTLAESNNCEVIAEQLIERKRNPLPPTIVLHEAA
ncbi:hypothetical protein M8J77_020005 [Diaphorina citri]|nr:hypothetical protein M8J77_020005 [Diaphorina citri]